MEQKRKCRKRRGWILLGIGALILMGTLHLDFLIPLLIGGFLVVKGWKLLKRNAGGDWWQATEPSTYPSSSPQAPTYNMDALDEWEKQLKNKK
ncbi:hypothetical protein AM501_29510 [Aneurinibacillus migulanus]|uniref:Uncharacterized protein n=1 Tax=Aneurinibacillus migulanus TaxID=47500 RepID=A0A0D1XSN9_ANEMI|nr:hypothetical protein [Aneurinibacillus migulanus]KIV56878.1 hypothetical protein TS64_08950 [Aneurinibacillus migulanus]KIV57266.1 hypothetical protein TS65_10905 [Aneurinibacillus migulanus]KON96839.1 hypothetical protein AF333_16475 [Aneurinibacillus migulanus]KPD04857.1 hypothetical protein AM501_29510 [Aneurinibacillus migulanus]MCP1359157.1 hypothetical protein [Aneurinibacillus migulanus]